MICVASKSLGSLGAWWSESNGTMVSECIGNISWFHDDILWGSLHVCVGHVYIIYIYSVYIYIYVCVCVFFMEQSWTWRRWNHHGKTTHEQHPLVDRMRVINPAGMIWGDFINRLKPSETAGPMNTVLWSNRESSDNVVGSWFLNIHFISFYLILFTDFLHVVRLMLNVDTSGGTMSEKTLVEPVVLHTALEQGFPAG